MKKAVNSSKSKNGEPIVKSWDQEAERPTSPGPHTAILSLQSALGNRTFAKVLSSAANSFQSRPGPSPQLSIARQARGEILQRKCACGGSPGPTGECEECRKKRLQRKLSIGSTHDPLELEADRLAEQALAGQGFKGDAGR
jgi:hypothetical protein